MGAYVNPKWEPKEEWLAREATSEISEAAARTHADFDRDLLVVWVDAGGHTAAAVAFEQRERDQLTDPDDFRPKKFYVVSKAKLRGVSNLDFYLSKSR